MSFRIRKLSVDLAASGQTQHVSCSRRRAGLPQYRGQPLPPVTYQRANRRVKHAPGNRWLRRLSKREEARTAA